MSDTGQERVLINDLTRGDSAAFDEIYRIYFPRVYTFTFKYLQNKQDAEGAVHDIFIKLWTNRHKLSEIDNLDAWLFKVTFNHIRKIFRNIATERKAMEAKSHQSIFEDNSTLSDIEFNDMMASAKEIIERIPPSQKRVLLLKMNDGLSNEQIAQKLKLSKRSVETYLTSAKKSVLKIFKEEQLIIPILLWFLF